MVTARVKSSGYLGFTNELASSAARRSEPALAAHNRLPGRNDNFHLDRSAKAGAREPTSQQDPSW